MNTSLTTRLTALCASIVTTLAVLLAVVSLGEPADEGKLTIAAAAAPAAR